MEPVMSMYVNRHELQKAKCDYEAGKTAAMLGAKRDQKPDRCGDEWYLGWDSVKGV